MKARLGNTLIYIADNAAHPSKTTTLKLLYIMEETMVRKYGIPFLGIPFEVWSKGPVQKDVFADISDGAIIFEDYISVKPGYREGKTISSKRAFDGDEFSEIELSMMEEVMRTFGQKTAEELVSILHKEDSLWYKTAYETGALDAFENKICNNTSIEFDFSQLLAEDKREHYKESLSIIRSANALKAVAHV